MCFDSGTTTTNTVQTSNLPQWVQDAGQANLALADQIGAKPYTAYTGPRVAGLTSEQQQGIQAVANTAGAWKSPVASAVNAAASAADSAFPGSYTAATVNPGTVTAGQLSSTDLTPYINPFTSNVLQSTIDQINRQYGQNQLAQQARATQQGAFGGARQGVVDAMLARDTTKQIADSTNQIMAQAFTNAQGAAQQDINQRMHASLANQSQGLNAQQFNANQALQAFNANAGQFNTDTARQLQAAQALGVLGQTTAQLGLADANALLSAGGIQQAQTQKSYDTAYQDFLNQQKYPQDMLNLRIATLAGTPYDKTTNASSTGPAANTTAQGIGALGALAGGLGTLAGSSGVTSLISKLS